MAIIAFGLAVMAFAFTVASAQPAKDLQLRNPYYPFTVELSVRDK